MADNDIHSDIQERDVPDRIDGRAMGRWLTGFATTVAAERDALTALDAAIGDADHGTNIDRGMRAVVAGLDRAAPPGSVLKQAGMTLIRTVGGASGPLFGTFFLRMATALGAADTVDLATFAAALRAGVDGVAARGKAQPADKTMLDALVPAVDALDAHLTAGGAPATALAAASAAANAGRDATVALLARKGRASYLGERSVGHQDPGATSAALLLAAAADAIG